MITRRPKVSAVFTPRRALVNDSMYIPRPEHEKELRRSVEGSLHTVVCGESGSGKSWLYKRVAEAQGWIMFNANAGNAARYKSLAEVIAQATLEEGAKELTHYTQKLGAKVGAFDTGGSTEAGRTYQVASRELLIRSFRAARERAGKKTAVLVVDNLEAIFAKKELMEELGNVILLLDDEDYAKYDIRILIVGVPGEVVEYYQRTDNLETVSNRLNEVSPVRSLKRPQIVEFIKRGFVEHLKVELPEDNLTTIARHVHGVTLGIAQRMHEYCEILGHCVEDNDWFFEKRLLLGSDHKYMLSCLKKSYSVIDSFMNERKTKAGRRNQVLFALRNIHSTEFDVQDVETHMRSEFPQSTNGTKLAVGQMIADLCSGAAPLLRKTPKGVSYRFTDPRHLMCLRVMLRKGEEETVTKARLAR